MSSKDSMSRRQFVARTSSLLVAGAKAEATADTAKAAPSSELALHGRQRALVRATRSLPRPSPTWAPSAASASIMQGPLYQKAVFQNHASFAGRWPIRELGLTTMDYTKQSCPEAEAIYRTGVHLSLHEGMTEDYILDAAKAIKKVARHYAV